MQHTGNASDEDTSSLEADAHGSVGFVAETHLLSSLPPEIGCVLIAELDRIGGGGGQQYC